MMDKCTAISKIKPKARFGFYCLLLVVGLFMSQSALALNGPTIRPYYIAPTDQAIFSCQTNIDLRGSNNAARAFNFFVDYGLTAEQSAGIVGNLVVESGREVDPTIHQGGGGPGRGIAQWEVGGRWDVLQQFAQTRGWVEKDLTTQLSFILFELTGEPRTDGMTGATERRAYNDLLNQTTVEGSAESFGVRFERPKALLGNSSPEDYQNAVAQRQRAARSVFDTFAGGGGGVRDIEADARCSSTGVPVTYDINGCPDGSVSKSSGEIVAVTNSIGNRIEVHKCIATAVEALFRDINLAFEDKDISGWGWRSQDSQIELRKQHCHAEGQEATDEDIYQKPSRECIPPTARPGSSLHERGLAIDVNVDGQTLCFRHRDCDALKFAGVRPVFIWLQNYAASYGLQKLSSEAWHWSVNGR